MVGDQTGDRECDRVNLEVVPQHHILREKYYLQ